MKKLILLLLPLLLTACAPAPYSYIKNLNHGRGTNLICFGDSLTAGQGAPAGAAYPDVLAGKVKYPVINAGVSGDTTATALARLQRDVLDKSPRLVIVELGANDYLHSPGSRTAEENAFSNLKQIVAEIQAAGAVVVIADVFITAGYSARYKNLASTCGALYLSDVLAGIMNDPGLMADTFHPNGPGYARMAENILKELQPLLDAISL